MLLLPTADRRRQLEAPLPEALIREARRRTLRRRARLAAAGALLVGLAAAAYALLAGGGPQLFRGTADTPYANARAFGGHGELAFVSRDQLWLLDGSGGTLRELRVPAGYEAQQPTFSRDGRWLAYLVRPTSTNYYGPFQLWLAHGDGGGAHRVRGVRLDQLVGWSPRSDLLAVTAGETKHAPFYSATALELLSPAGHTQTLLRAPLKPAKRWGIDAVNGAAWSPSGRALAVVLVGELASKIETLPANGSGHPTVWFARGGGRVPVAGMRGRVPTEVVPELAGWWAHWGIGFWVIDGGAVDNRDSTPLAVISRPGATPRYLTQTLSLGMSKEFAPGPGGKLAVVSSAEFGREIGVGKTVETCTPARMKCAAVGAATTWSGPNTQACLTCHFEHIAPSGKPGSGVSLDPSWSPGGGLLAFVKAPVAETSGWPGHAWFADHAVYLWNATTGATRRLGNVDGSALPTWSADGRDLLYERDDGLWLMPVATGKPIEIVHPLYAQTQWNSKVSPLASVSYYGQIPWQSQFSWWSRPG